VFRPAPLFIGLRYTRAERRNHYISFVSLSSMLGLLLGVAVLITVTSVINGFGRELQNRVLGVVPHGAMLGYNYFSDWRDLVEQVERHKGVEAAAPFLQVQGMMTNNSKAYPVLLNGIQPEMEAKVSVIGGQNLIASDRTRFVPADLNALKPGEFGVLLGEKLAKQIDAKVGDQITFLIPEAATESSGVTPRFKRLTLKGIFQVGSEVDGVMALAHLQDVQQLMKLSDEVAGIRLKFTDLFDAPRLTYRIVDAAGKRRFQPSDWTRTHGNLYESIKMTKAMIGLLLVLVVTVAVFNLLSSLVMTVTDKSSDIAILRTLGATPRQIMGVFMVQGTLIGVVGTLAGVGVGLLVAANVTDFIEWLSAVTHHEFMQAYFINYLPSEVHWQDIALIAGAAVVLSFLATLYPAYRAALVQPAEALRFD